MQQLLLYISLGYRYWHSGEVKHAKAVGFVAKMYELYPALLLKETARMRAKQKGKANVRLVLFFDRQRPDALLWWLLATPGSGLVHEREKMKDATVYPLRWLDQYALKRVTSVYRPQGGVRRQKQAWSWVFLDGYRAELRAAVKSYADAEPGDAGKALGLLFGRLRHMPLFAGVRDELQALDGYGRETFEKKHRQGKYPGYAGNLPFMTRVKVFGDLELQSLLAALAEEQAQRSEAALDEARSVVAGVDAPGHYTQSLVTGPDRPEE